MNIELVKTSPNGQVVIPQTLRKKLGLEPNDLIHIQLIGDVLVVKKLELESLAKHVRGGKK